MSNRIVITSGSAEVVQAFRSLGFSASFQVSKNSVFSDDVWDYNDDEKPRLARFKNSNRLRLFWAGPNCAAQAPIPPSMLTALRTFSVLHQIEPGTVVPRSAGTNNPVTVCQTMHTFLAFLGHVLHVTALVPEPGAEQLSFRSITLSQLRSSLKSWGKSNQDRIRRVLTGLTSVVLKELCGDLVPTWTAADVAQLEFLAPDYGDKDLVLPNPLFRLVSNEATEVVCGFLAFLGLEALCGEGGRTTPAIEEANRAKVGQMYSDFICIRHQRMFEEGALQNAMSPVSSQTLQSNFRAKYDCAPSEFLEYLYSVSDAACTIIALYTGCRYSDLGFFRVGCVNQVNGLWFLTGTHIKHQDVDKPVGIDNWPAIPIMRDAVAVLEELKRLSLNPYLVSSLRTTGDKRPYSSSGLLSALGRFFRAADTQGTWKGVTLSTQRFRNTLAHQLARADVGLVFISRHLKHLHASLSGRPAEVTLGYGNIKALKMERAVQGQSLRKDVARSLYDPDAPLAGGGGPAFMEERKQYFQGRLAAGMEKEEIIEELTAAGLPFSNVGPGFCTGRKEIQNKDGSKRKPPCVGSLQCSPNDCHNAIISVVHVHLWRRVARQNAQLARRPDMAYAKAEHLNKVEIAEGVLRKLGEQV